MVRFGLAVCCDDRRRACGNGCDLQRPIDCDGAIFAAGILSPSVLMGVERGNIDFSVLALVAGRL
jgi:hypothetical protein